jgi:hypothetical protein
LCWTVKMTSLLKPKDVADYLQVSEATVRKNGEAWGGIRIGKQWRFHPRILDELTPKPRESGNIAVCNEPPESESTKDQNINGVFAGESMEKTVKSAAIRHRRRPRTGLPTFAEEFGVA